MRVYSSPLTMASMIRSADRPGELMLPIQPLTEPDESSRPKELPLQPLTEPDVNLSIYPALIDQPQAVYIASEEKGLVHAVQFG